MRPERKHITGLLYQDFDPADAFEDYLYNEATGEVVAMQADACTCTSYILNKAAPSLSFGTQAAVAGVAAQPLIDTHEAVNTDFDPQTATWNAQYFDGSVLGVPRMPAPGIREGKEMRMWNFTMRCRVRCPIIGPGAAGTAAQYLANPPLARQWIGLVLVSYVPAWDQAATDAPPGNRLVDELRFEDLFEPGRKAMAQLISIPRPEDNEDLDEVGSYNVLAPFQGLSERWHYGRRRRGLGRIQEQQVANANGAQGVDVPEIVPRLYKKIKLLWKKKIVWKPTVSSDDNLDPTDAISYGITGKGRQERGFGVKLRFKGRKVVWSDVPAIPFTGANQQGGGPLGPYGNFRAVDGRPSHNQLRLVYWDNYRIVYPQQADATTAGPPALLKDPNGPRFAFDYDLGLTDN